MVLVDKSLVEKCMCFPVRIEDIMGCDSNYIPEMYKTMIKNHAVGLAAPQVGIHLDFFIMKYGNILLKVFNPIWKPRNEKTVSCMESCLTYGRKKLVIKRYKSINVVYNDLLGNTVRKKLHGMDARVFQHECDHLWGKTIFYDPGKQNG